MSNCKKYSSSINRYTLIASDLLSVLIVFFMSWFLESQRNSTEFSHIFVAGTDVHRVWNFLAIAVIFIFLSWVVLRSYTYRKPFWNELKGCLILIVVMSVIDLAIVAISKWSFSRYQWLFFWGGGIILIPLFRWLTKSALLKLGFWTMPSLIVGCGQNAYEAYNAIKSERLLGFGVLGFISPVDDCVSSPVLDIPVINTSPERVLEDFSHCKFFIALEHEQAQLVDDWLRYLSAHGIRNISVIPPMRGVPLYGTEMSYFFSHELIMLRVKNNLARPFLKLSKRLFDLCIATGILLLLSPVMFYIGWKVSRDGASPFYGHERIGYEGRTFKCLKFRSMIANSAEVLEDLLRNDPDAKREWESDFKLKNDPRITKLGHFIRKTSLDELPQLFNVIKGEMSLVGPRPIVREELERYGDDKVYYLMVKPGITGLWQVSGRNDVDYATRVYLDSWYVKNWALWNDIAIMFKTISVVLNRTGAY